MQRKLSRTYLGNADYRLVYADILPLYFLTFSYVYPSGNHRVLLAVWAGVVWCCVCVDIGAWLWCDVVVLGGITQYIYPLDIIIIILHS